MVGNVYLTEKPIIKIGSDIYGPYHCSRPSFSHDDDQKILYGKAWLPMMQRMIDRTEIPINLVVLNGFHNKKFQFCIFSKDTKNSVYSSLEETLEKYGISLIDKENRLNMFVTGNSGPNRLPMTPWITIHRAMHGYQLNEQRDNKLWEMMIDNNLLKKMVSNHAELFLLSGEKIVVSKTKYADDYDEKNEQFAKLVFDTRTLRTGQHLNSGLAFGIDLVCELWTEYFFKSKITIKIDAVIEKYKDFSNHDCFKKLIDELKEFEIWVYDKFNQHVLSKTGEYVCY